MKQLLSTYQPSATAFNGLGVYDPHDDGTRLSNNSVRWIGAESGEPNADDIWSTATRDGLYSGDQSPTRGTNRLGVHMCKQQKCDGNKAREFDISTRTPTDQIQRKQAPSLSQSWQLVSLHRSRRPRPIRIHNPRPCGVPADDRRTELRRDLAAASAGLLAHADRAALRHEHDVDPLACS